MVICVVQTFFAFVPQFQHFPSSLFQSPNEGAMQALRRDKNESTTYDYESVVDSIVAHWMKVMVALSRVCLGSAEGQGRLPRQRRFHNFDTRLNWNVFMEKFQNRAEFKRHIRMSADSFNKLTNLIRPALEVDEDMANL
jgi:hypothetical protein